MNYEQFRKKLEKSDSLFFQHVKKAAIRSSLRLEAGGKKRAPVKFGYLRSSIFGQAITRDGEFVVTIRAGGQGGGQDVFYAAFLEFGTSRIEPRLFLGKSVAEEEPILQEELGTALKMTLDFTQ